MPIVGSKYKLTNISQTGNNTKGLTDDLRVMGKFVQDVNKVIEHMDTH